jgi:hypothetical protein
MKVKVEQAIKMARNKESLKDIVIEGLNDTQVRPMDALVLAEYGILIPEQNIYYSDEDIAYDPDFDDVTWRDEPLKLTWEEKIQLAEEIAGNKIADEEVSVRIRIEDREIRQWMRKNYDKMGQVLSNFIVEIYKANKIMEKP